MFGRIRWASGVFGVLRGIGNASRVHGGLVGMGVGLAGSGELAESARGGGGVSIPQDQRICLAP